MSEYIVDNFSDVLSQEDVLELFRRLQDETGSITAAAETCGLERKTIYDWKESGYLKLTTKRKVLKALLDHIPRIALSFVTQRTFQRALDSFRIVISTIYEQTVSESDPVKIEQSLREFESTLNEYRGLAWHLSRDEIPRMFFELRQHAASHGVQWTHDYRSLETPSVKEPEPLLLQNEQIIEVPNDTSAWSSILLEPCEIQTGGLWFSATTYPDHLRNVKSEILKDYTMAITRQAPTHITFRTIRTSQTAATAKRESAPRSRQVDSEILVSPLPVTQLG